MDTALPVRRTGRRRLAGAVAAAAVAAAAVVVITDPFGGSGTPPAPTYSTSTATVVRRALISSRLTRADPAAFAELEELLAFKP